jgi:protein-S-isoprenylcysteine O-methyltransferase Ste14
MERGETHGEESGMTGNEYVRVALKGFFGLLFMVALVFVSAGRLDYWQGWLFVVVTLGFVLVEAVIFSKRPGLIRERMKPGPGTKGWDKVFWALYIPVSFAIVIIASVDVGRFGWSPDFPVYVYLFGYAMFLLSNVLKCWSMWVNDYFSSTVRIQKDRGQRVVQDGPYRFVRHPGYVAGILLGISMSLILGSLWALVPAGLMVLLLVVRTYMEDNTLKKELKGYESYAKKVRYRLLPRVW